MHRQGTCLSHYVELCSQWWWSYPGNSIKCYILSLYLKMLTTKWFCQTPLYSLSEYYPWFMKSIWELTHATDPKQYVRFHLPLSKLRAVDEPKACVLLVLLTCLIVVPGRIRRRQPLVYLLTWKKRSWAFGSLTWFGHKSTQSIILDHLDIMLHILHSFICVDSHPPIKLLHQTLAALLALVDAGFHIIGNLELNNSGCDRDHIRYQTQIRP